MRLLDIPAQRKHGAWDELHQSANGTAFSDGLKTESVTHYGHAGRAFLEKLSRDKASFTEALDKVKAMPVFAVVADDGQVKRAAGRFAVIALAGELATEYGVTGWTQGEAIAAAGVGFAAWQLLRGTGKGNSERDQISERIASFIERHGDSRFSNADAIEDDHMPTVRDRAGWWQDGGGHDSTGRVYLFTADGMREAVKGFDFNRALDALQELGAIDAPGAGKERAKSHRMGGRKVRVYAVNAEKLAGVA